MASLSAKGPPMTCSEEAEILACHRTVEFAMECGFSELVVEGDNQLVMDALKLEKSLSSRVGHILQDVSCLLKGLRWSQVQFIRRSANTVAHTLVRHAKNVSHEIIWMEESPLPAIEALYMDSTFI